MTITSKRAWSRGAAVALSSISAFAMIAVASPAHAAVTGPSLSFSDYGDGYNDVMDGRSANKIIVSSQAGSVAVFSLSPDADYVVDPAVPYIPVDVVDEASRAAAWVAVNAPGTGTPLEDPKLEAVAQQLAVWKLASGTDYSSVENAEAVSRADELSAAASPLAAPPVAYSATATWSSPTTLAVEVSVSGYPVPGISVTAGDSVAVTDDLGVASFEGVTDLAVASVSALLPAGTVLVADGGPFVVTTEEVSAPFDIDVPVPPVSVTEETSDPTDNSAGEQETTATVDSGTGSGSGPAPGDLNNGKVEKLPWTGSSIPAWLPLAALAVALGSFIAGRRLLRG